MSNMDTDELPVVLPSTTTSTLSLSLHPLPILNISEHLTRMKLQKNTNAPFVIGGLLGSQNGREVEIVNTFELAMDDDAPDKLNHAFCVSRKEQYKQVFPSLELIGWYTVAQQPTAQHIALHEQFVSYTPNPILLVLQPFGSSKSDGGHALPLKAYEQTVEIRDRSSRNVFVEASYSVETGEAERIAVDWTAKGGEGGTSLDSHLQTQRAAVKMLHDRIQLLIQYVAGVVAGTSPKDYTALRSLSALVASLPASEHPGFREEFNKEYEDVQLTAFLSALTNSANVLNDLVDKHIVVSSGSGRDERGGGMGLRRRGMGRGPATMGMNMMGDWDRYH
ncbi:maintenance of mitochondrial structure and function-domain-containing protein [Phellopilus nigrolimitatus]|nr:maintenance of mitochondrial structure and function-domain-containing protein [Phellopilus nigrolimitatus]